MVVATLTQKRTCVDIQAFEPLKSFCFCLMVFNATFNNISVISSVFLVEENGGPGENHRPVLFH